MRFAIYLLTFFIALACAEDSFAYSRHGKWANNATVNLYIKDTDWPVADRDYVKRQLINAAHIWNSAGSSSIELKYAGTSTTGWVTNGKVEFDRGTCGYTPCAALAETYWRRGEGTDLLHVFVHEIGHGIGFNHSSAAYSVMRSSANFSSRFLERDDIDGLLSDATWAYTENSTKSIKVLLSIDGLSFSTVGASVGTTAMRPAITYGKSNSSAQYMLAWTQPDRVIVTAKGSAMSWSSVQTHSTFTSDGPPSLTYGQGKYVLIYTELANTKRIKMTTSTTGVTWTTPVTISP